METILDAIGRHAAVHGGERAYWTPRGTWTFAELWDTAGRAATGLAHQGIGRGDRVACLTKHTAECVALVLAACRIGAVCMPVNWRLAPPEIDYIVKDGRARFMMADKAFAPSVPRARSSRRSSAAWARGFEPMARKALRRSTIPRCSSIPPAPPDCRKAWSSRTATSPRG